jgi:CBS domain-containing protein
VVVRARDVMSTPVLTAREFWSVAWAAEALARNGFTALPVVDEHERLVGIVTEGDLVVDTMDGSRGRPTTVGGVMSTDVVTVPAHLDLSVVAHRMQTLGVRAVPVIDHGRLAGIVTRRDLLSARRPAGG